MHLNPQQKQAVFHFSSPLLIIAGAGAGKTMVLTHKIAVLVNEMNINPSNILGITFTNKAAKEMRERVSTLLGKEGRPADEIPTLTTFHSLCLIILKRYFHHLGWSNDFTILDSDDQKKLLKKLLQDMEVSEDDYPLHKVMGVIHLKKNQLVGPNDYSLEKDADPIIATAYRRYQKDLQAQQGLDFDDLLFWAVQLCISCPTVLQSLHEKYRYILVDEYQDTNHAQYVLVRLISRGNKNLVVVGDFDQNIYSWRGANIKYILNFQRDFPDADTIYLEQNYRSTQTILNAANGLIKNNKERKEKKLWTDNHKGSPILVKVAIDERKEAKFIVDKIREFKKEFSYSDIAILVRINALTRVLEDELMTRSIPYKLIGGPSFFARAEIKDVLAYLRLIHSFSDKLALERIIGKPRRALGDKRVQELLQCAKSLDIDIEKVPYHPEFRVTPKVRQTWIDFFNTMLDLRVLYEKEESDKLGTVIEKLIKSTGYDGYLKTQPKHLERLENLSEFIAFAREEETELSEFLNKVMLASGTESESDESVTLMTLHNAKGLEFGVVFMVGLEEGILPHYRSFDNNAEMEEERRLAYVGITRGKKHVVLTRAIERQLFGKFKSHKKSRFIEELPEDTYELDGHEFESSVSSGFGLNYPKDGGSGSSGFGDYKSKESFYKEPSYTPKSVNTETYSVGQKVEHKQWGPGTISNVYELSDGQKLVINFSGQFKTLLSKYAPLTII
ncbi:UvrD-helicase domain-containing protein [bacterium]|nr:UvrD-helicase domain-containing protein [bacterium]